jgi:hypothetical protein
MRSERLGLVALEATVRVLSPIVPLLLELGVGVGDVETLIKKLFVTAADAAIRSPPGASRNAPSKSHKGRVTTIAVRTGLTRAMVGRLLETGEDRDENNLYGRPRAERVISGWLHDPEFRDERTGRPALLPMAGEKKSFTSLVKRHAGDPRVRTIREELKRVKAIRRRSDGRWELIRETYAPSGLDAAAISLLGEHAEDYIRCLVHNVLHPGLAHFTKHVLNVRVDPDEVGKLLRFAALQADATMETLDAAINDPAATLGLEETTKRGERLGAGFFLVHSVQNAQSQRAPDGTTGAVARRRKRNRKR